MPYLEIRISKSEIRDNLQFQNEEIQNGSAATVEDEDSRSCNLEEWTHRLAKRVRAFGKRPWRTIDGDPRTDMHSDE